MQKKLTTQGPNDRKSYTVTLPKEWVTSQKLDKSRLIDMDLVGSKIIISPYLEEQETIIIDAEKYKKTLIKLMQGIYRAGLNDIKLKFKDSSTVEEIVSISEKLLIGYEVVEHKKDYIIVRDITHESEQSFKALLRRVFLLIFELFDASDKIGVDTLNKNIQKLTNYCKRILIKRGHQDYKKTPLYYLMLDRLDKLSEEVTWLSETSLNKDEDKIFTELKNLFRNAYDIFYKFDAAIYNDSAYRLYIMRNSIRDTSSKRSAIHLHNIARSMNSLYSDILAVCVDED